MSNASDHSATSYSLPSLGAPQKEGPSKNDINHPAPETETVSSNDALNDQIFGSIKQSASNVGTEAFEIDEAKDGSLHKEDIMPKMITSIKMDRWHESIDHSTSNEKILETLSLASYEFRMSLPRLSVKNVEGEAILFFEELHLYNIRQLQLKLLGISRSLEEGYLTTGQTSGDKLNEVLHCYRQALDDFESIQSKFQRYPSHLSKMGGLATYLKDQGISVFCLGEGHSSNAQKKLQFFLSVASHTVVQFIFAAVGGLALIVPMLIMVFVPGRTSSVVTTCVSVFIFATALAAWSSVAHFVEYSENPTSHILQVIGLRFGGFEPKDIVLITATYAAVLMVFVGANS